MKVVLVVPVRTQKPYNEIFLRFQREVFRAPIREHRFEDVQPDEGHGKYQISQPVDVDQGSQEGTRGDGTEQ